MRIACLALLALGVSLPVQARAQTERHTLTGSRPVIFDLVGEIHIEKGSGSGVVVELTRGGADAGRLQVETAGDDELRVVFPSDRIVYPRMHHGNTDVRVRDDGTFGTDMGGGRRVRVSGQGDGLEAWADLRILVPDGQRVEVHLGTGKMLASAVSGDLRLEALSGDITVDGARGSLAIASGSGDVSARSVEGELELSTGSGDVRLDDGKGNRARLSTGSGDISGSGLDYARQTLRTGSGDVTLEQVGANDVEVSTGSGDIELSFTRDLTDLRARTGSGDVTLGLLPTTGATVDLHSSSGDLETDIPLTIRRQSRNHVTGTIGDGRGTIQVQTGSGDVRLRRE